MQGVLLIITVSILIFSLLYIMPGDPIDMMVDRKVPEAKKIELRAEYGFDQPMHKQYFNWVKGIVVDHDLGMSIRYKIPAWDLIKERIPLSFTLCGWALLIEMVIALPLGLLCAIKKDSLFDRITVNSTLLMTAVPDFWIAVLLILIFGVTLKWLPLSGYTTPQHFIMPVAAAVFSSVAGTIRMTKTEVLDVLQEKYVLTAYAKGLPEQKVMVKHVLRNALILVTVLVFMSIPWLISGAIVLEKIFDIPGMGKLLLNSIIVQDFSVVQACILMVAVLTVICNLISDIVIGFLDPRIRISMGGGDN